MEAQKNKGMAGGWHRATPECWSSTQNTEGPRDSGTCWFLLGLGWEDPRSATPHLEVFPKLCSVDPKLSGGSGNRVPMYYIPSPPQRFIKSIGTKDPEKSCTAKHI